MLPNLKEGTLYFNGEPLGKAMPDLPPLDPNDPPPYISSIISPLSTSAEFTLEAEIDTQAYNRFVGIDHAIPCNDCTGFSVIYSKPCQEQVRRHKKKRINKKWAKRYGYVTKFKKYCIDQAYFRNPADEYEYEFYTNNIRRL